MNFPLNKVSSWVAITLAGIAGILALKGKSLSAEQQGSLSQVLTVVFGALAAVIAYVQHMHIHAIDKVTAETDAKVADWVNRLSPVLNVAYKQYLAAKLPSASGAYAQGVSPATVQPPNTPIVKLLILGLLSTVIVSSNLGCAANTPLGALINPNSSDQTRLNAMKTAYEDAMLVLTVAREDKLISDKDWHNIAVASQTFVDTVGVLQSDVKAGQKLADLPTLLDAATTSMTSITNAKGNVPHAASNNNSGSRPSTSPAISTDSVSWRGFVRC